MSIYRINTPRNAQANFHVKKNDEVVVLSGTQQGQRGKVLEVLRDRSRVIIEGVNFIKRHTRKSPNQPEGGIVEREATIHLSNLALADPKDGKPTRVGFKFIGEGEDRKKVRVAKRSGAEIDG